MKRNTEFFLSSERKGQRGQVLPLIVLSLAAIMGMAALVFDVGIVYYSYSELQASTQAATLAGAAAMALPGATTASVTSAVSTYSAVAGKKNAFANLPGVTLVTGYNPNLYCSTTLVNSFGIQCVAPSSSNALKVQQQVTIPTIFARLFGTGALTLTATASAGMRGSSLSPYNVVIVVDSTASMNSTDSSSDCNNTRISCALAGVQVLLQNLSPCASNLSSCGAATNGNVANSVDRVSLLTFPAVTTLTAAADYTCLGTPVTVPYATPFPATSTYQIVNFSSDYRTSDSATSLNSASHIVEAVGHGSTAGCLDAQGGQGTYYAQVIYQAQAYLVAEQALFPNSQNVLILLSDGDASATCTLSSHGVCTAGAMVGAATTGSGAYISTLDQCQQAITAAQAAAAAGTRVYSVAYGAKAAGCSTDTPAITPCQTMQQIASDPAYFFSDYAATGGSGSCIADSQPATSLNQIFQTIAGDLTVARLIPNNTP